MSINCGVYQCSEQLVLLGRCPQVHQLQKSPDSKKPFGLQLPKSWNSQLALKNDAILLKAAASSSSSSSPAEYSELLLGVKPKQKRQGIAGIDQDELQDPARLADPDSCFCEFKGIRIHHKICDAESLDTNLSENITISQISDNTKRVGFPMILLHGFGASVFSWDRIMKPLTQVTKSKVLAFDRPAFGLTSRVDPTNYSPPGSEDARPLNPYSIMFSVLASLYFIDFLAAEKAILVGHSAGSLVAVDTYFEAPERVAAMVLVAPAIFAPLNFSRGTENGRNNQKQEEHSDSDDYLNPIIRVFSRLSKLTKYIAQAIVQMLKGMGDMINSLYKKALSAILRSGLGLMLVRMVIGKFGIPAVRNSWYDQNQVTDHVLQGYTKPLRVKGWDRALVEYTVAMLADSSSHSKPPLAKRLSEISCPVLIVTGDSDLLVPPWNSQRLSRVIPGSCLEVIKNCGHLPHEEKAEEFVSVVEKFLDKTFGTSDERCLQAFT